MATRTDEPAGRPMEPGPGTGRGLGANRTGRDRPVGGFELWSWLFMRVSGLLLLFLAVGHVLIMHVIDEGVERVDFAFVQLRWGSPFWRTWDWLLLTFALIHGVNGLRVIVLDYVRRPGARFVLNWFFYLTGTVLFFLGTVIVFTFDPSAWPATS
ncbi:MAG: succinate dehydrogenase hydrophobic membrane anchor subunit [Actinobacteria bacterium]|nr:succinate dehydrogenase hydrophobic membrane anchor subunit [Actinomycetota bacterium]